MWKHSELFTVSVATQPHCQLHPPPLLMTLHVSEVQKQRERTKRMKLWKCCQRESVNRSLAAYLLPCDSCPVQNG